MVSIRLLVAIAILCATTNAHSTYEKEAGKAVKKLLNIHTFFKLNEDVDAIEDKIEFMKNEIEDLGFPCSRKILWKYLEQVSRLIEKVLSIGYKCRIGYLLHPDNICIRYYDEPLSYKHAKQVCLKEGGTLLRAPRHDAQFFKRLVKLVPLINDGTVPHLWLNEYDGPISTSPRTGRSGGETELITYAFNLPIQEDDGKEDEENNTAYGITDEEEEKGGIYGAHTDHGHISVYPSDKAMPFICQYPSQFYFPESFDTHTYEPGVVVEPENGPNL